MKSVANYLVLIGIVQFIIANMVYDLFGFDKVWFLSNALTLFIWAFAYYLINKGLAANVAMFFSFNMLWEEVFSDPLMTSLTEYLTALIFLIIISIQYLLKNYARVTNGNINKI